MTEEPLISFCIITHDRRTDAVKAINSTLSQEYENIEVVVIASKDGDTYEFLSKHFGQEDRVSVYEEKERRGVPGARNDAFEQASGDIYVIIDDDAEFHSTNSARNIAEAFREYPDVGSLCFKSVTYESAEPIPTELPTGPDGKHPNERYFTTYFIGVGAAFRADVINTVDGFPEEFFYYMEELDLSFQILDAGYRFLYMPDVVVLHKDSEGARPDKDDQWRLTLENRIRVAIRHLPWRYVITSATIWTLYVLYRTRFSVRTVLTAFRNIRQDWESLIDQRDIISLDTCRRISNLSGRLWY